MQPKHHVLGKSGEDLAVKYLTEHHHEILGRNVRFGRDELDIVSYDQKEKMIVFTEVKTRSENNQNYPIRTSVDMRKRQCLRRAVAQWCSANEYDGPARIDIVCIAKGAIVEHIKDMGSDFQ